MIKYLLVENYALIDKLDIWFEKGFTVITGETGAGKSIILGALGLILGNRADTGVLLDVERKCIVEGHFTIENQDIAILFEKHLLDYSDLATFRREISPNGRSRAFINDTPVSLEVMKEIASRFINIHSQHNNLTIGTSSFQFDVVDGFSGNIQRVNAYRESFRQNALLEKELEILEVEERKMKSELDYYLFQHNELEKARLDSRTFGLIENELEILQNAEEIKLALEKSAYLLSNSESSILSSLKEVSSLLKQLTGYSDEYKILFSRLESIFIETKDLGGDIQRNSERVVADPAIMAELQGKVDLVNKLLLKHGLKEVSELEELRDALNDRISGIDSFEIKIAKLKKVIEENEKGLSEAADEISKARFACCGPIEESVAGLLQRLAMPGAKFSIGIERGIQLTHNGFDSIEFLFSANPDGEPRQVSKIASGGEISRLMLAVKSLISQRNLLPTIIFDEIDSGVSGETANRVADILDSISRTMQVIVITHLPQIASRGKQHLVVRKTTDNNKTTSTIVEVKENGRVAEIAQMLGGNNPTQAMITTARELIKQ